MNRIETVLQSQDYVELKALSKKCRRNTNMPYPKFSRRVSTFIQFLGKQIRIEVLNANEVSEKGSTVCSLFLHYRKSTMLSRHEITRLSKTALRQYDPEIINISTTSLRTTFSPNLFHGFNDGLVVALLTEETFLAESSRYMKTLF